jgi:hypothetical protein
MLKACTLPCTNAYPIKDACPVTTVCVTCCVSADPHTVRNSRDISVAVVIILRRMHSIGKGGTSMFSAVASHQIRDKLLQLVNSIVHTVRDFVFGLFWCWCVADVDA